MWKYYKKDCSSQLHRTSNHKMLFSYHLKEPLSAGATFQHKKQHGSLSSFAQKKCTADDCWLAVISGAGGLVESKPLRHLPCLPLRGLLGSELTFLLTTLEGSLLLKEACLERRSFPLTQAWWGTRVSPFTPFKEAQVELSTFRSPKKYILVT